MNQDISVAPNRRKAVTHLLTTTCLAGHPHVTRYVSLDTWTFDYSKLEDFGWSDGELVLLHLFFNLAGYPRKVTIDEMWRTLDLHHKRQALRSLWMAMLDEDPLV